ncbi:MULTISPECIES: 6-phosphogluconate dehydrogenase [Flavobacterium]|uniref:6-phosphogluconate dehydrogenase n=1 Tax=Flavobacterium salmonis TaxID=2654844 RepID=A0A6V6Z0A8_9FLAO|nr:MULTISPECIES: 6-phosphogluconate dehydrogenase [Flavobacterium]OOV18575.1 6-phosphogluconate dehydrogenase [Flavobacterium sp. LM4]CAD0005115.1 6-phosphogluconate dehydrogenase [Flavobacterium salmonis]
MKRILMIIAVACVLIGTIYFAFIYYVPYSEGYRSGELIKLSHKGVMMKTWEGELSQGVSGSQIFRFSVLDSDKKVIDDLNELQGQYVKLTYVERYKTFSWWGDTQFFITAVQKENSPFKYK